LTLSGVPDHRHPVVQVFACAEEGLGGVDAEIGGVDEHIGVADVDA
jgi:hypothetical protein